MPRKKENKKDELSIDEEIKLIKERLLALDPNYTADEIFAMDKKLDNVLKNNKLRTLAINLASYLIMTLIIIIITLLINLEQNKNYKIELENRLNTQIANVNYKDSLFNKYLGVDIKGSYTTTSEKGRLLSYKDLDKSRDSIILESLIYKDSVKVLNQRLRMAKESYGIYFTNKKIGNDNYIMIGSTEFEKMENNSKLIYEKTKPLVDTILKHK